MGAEDRDRLLTAAELADYLAVPLRTVYAWRYQGARPVGLRIGRHLRFRWADVQVWLEECAARR